MASKINNYLINDLIQVRNEVANVGGYRGRITDNSLPWEYTVQLFNVGENKDTIVTQLDRNMVTKIDE